MHKNTNKKKRTWYFSFSVGENQNHLPNLHLRHSTSKRLPMIQMQILCQWFLVNRMCHIYHHKCLILLKFLRLMVIINPSTISIHMLNHQLHVIVAIKKSPMGPMPSAQYALRFVVLIVLSYSAAYLLRILHANSVSFNPLLILLQQYEINVTFISFNVYFMKINCTKWIFF